ncbi:hypothetical protein LCGC14_0924430 [marine sediment metagenome]|uniref:Uncharacterized protein n=1 Tax=marine sediment metagenome TaxID=412755 RepID=A0A0F9R8I9_9ZZZZ
MKLTINLYAALERDTEQNRATNAALCTEDISYHLNKLFSPHLKFEIIDEEAEGNWTWLAIIGEAHERSQDEDIIDWLEEELPDLLDLDTETSRFKGIVGKHAN